MANGLYYYKLVSPYPEDVTKNCKLTINEIDSNFVTLKDNDIKKAEFIRDEKTLVLTRNNGEKLIVNLDDVTYNLDVNAECGESGTTLTISYDGKEGKNTVTIANILTADNLMDIIGSDILTKVITDGTLKGHGTMDSPLGISGVEKTGMLAPALEVFDLTTGGTLPYVAKLGTRYVTKEYVNDYGYLYNGAGLAKISQRLKDDYIGRNTREDARYAWRVPSKADWDALLNSIEPCKYRNHGSAKCHVELGKVAGKYLKSECGWINSEYECTCTGKRPYTGCSTNGNATSEDIDSSDYIFDSTDTIPSDKEINPVGVDKYGMTILPSGTAGFKKTTETPFYNGFKETAAFWTTSVIAPGQDTYIKIFNDDMSGVYQVAECPDPYYSVRLVKKYDGSNYRETEYIDGILYRCILFPESGQIWLASNFADKNGFLTVDNYKTAGANAPEVLDPNGGFLPNEKRIEMFINEYNGRYWEKKVMDEGVTIVIQNPCFDSESGNTVEFCWIDGDDYERCIEIEIPKVAQSNIEYRVYIEDEGCNKVLKNTDDLVVERVLSIVVPMIDEERWEREKADVVLSGAIDDLRDALNEEISARTEADEFLQAEIDELREDLDEEISARTAADEALSGAIDDLRAELSAETEARIEADEFLQEEIDELREDLIDNGYN